MPQHASLTPKNRNFAGLEFLTWFQEGRVPDSLDLRKKILDLKLLLFLKRGSVAIISIAFGKERLSIY